MSRPRPYGVVVWNGDEGQERGAFHTMDDARDYARSLGGDTSVVHLDTGEVIE